MLIYKVNITNFLDFEVELTSKSTDSLKTVIMSLVGDIRYDRVSIVFTGFNNIREFDNNDVGFIWSNKTNERADIIDNLAEAFYKYKTSVCKYNYVHIYLE